MGLGSYISAHFIGVAIIFLLMCMSVGVLAMHITNRESARTWARVSVRLLEVMEANERRLEEMQKLLASSIKNQAGFIVAVREMAARVDPPREGK